MSPTPIVVYTTVMTFDPKTVAAVVFDIGGVFTYPDYQPVADGLESLGYGLPSDVVDYRRAHHAGALALARVEARSDDNSLAAMWLAYDVAYGRTLGVGQDQIDDLRPFIRTHWRWAHLENIAAFHRLTETGKPTAIVSNNNGTAPEQMRRHGVCQVGEGPLPSTSAIVDSTLVGVAKPDPRIFDPALQALSLDPAGVLYVGDTVHADVKGALAAGMQVVQLDPFDHHVDFAHSRVSDVSTLVSML